MKYSLLILILLLATPLMTHSVTNVVYFDDIQKVVNANNQGYFTVTKTEGAYLSFEVLPVLNARNIVLSLFLESGTGIDSVSEFLIYPVGRISNEAEASGFVIAVETEKSSFVDIPLPNNFFEGVDDPVGVVIKATGEETFVFRGLDETPQASHIIIEGGQFPPPIKQERAQLSSNDKQLQEETYKQSKIAADYARLAAENSTKRWYEKFYFTVPLGVILGILSSIAYSFLKRWFPFL